jgi:hypothetical protein
MGIGWIADWNPLFAAKSGKLYFKGHYRGLQKGTYLGVFGGTKWFQTNEKPM